MKKIVLTFLGLLFSILVSCIFGIGGKTGAICWCTAVFVIAPIALILSLIQVILLVFRMIKKKKIAWNAVFLGITIIYAFPILVLLGVSPVTYPTPARESEFLQLQQPVENGIYFGGREYRTHAY